jgi:predicted kinase
MGSWVDQVGEQLKEHVPLQAQLCRDERDGARTYHITVIMSTELTCEMVEKVEYLLSQRQAITARLVGSSFVTKGAKQSWYAAVYCPWADEAREKLGLQSKEYHVTLGFLGGDLHGQPSIYQTIKWSSEQSLWIQVTELIAKTAATTKCLTSTERMLLRRAYTVFSSHDELGPELIKGLRDVAYLLMQFNPALAGDAGYFLLGKGLPVSLQILLHSRPDLRNLDELGSLLPVPLAAAGSLEAKLGVIRDCNITVLSRATYTAGKKPYSRTHVFGVQNRQLQLLLLQRNFSWVTLARDERLSQAFDAGSRRCLPYLLAGSAIPTEAVHVSGMASIGIRHIITVHENPLPAALCRTVLLGAEAGITTVANSVAAGEVVSYHFHVADRTPPSFAHLRAMCGLIHSAVSRNEGVLVHCQGGVGRTNTVIIAYLMWAQNLSAAEATAQVTAQRSIILSQSQKGALQRWWAECNERRNGELSSDTGVVTAVPTQILPYIEAPRALLPGSIYRKTASALKMPTLIVLCGFPASGKSTFSKALVQHTDYFVRINKDEMRGKNQCEDTLFDALGVISKGKVGGKRPAVKEAVISADVGTVVVDCCNLTSARRKEWLQLAHNPRAWCVFFDVGIQECKARISKRSGHPTIHTAEAGIRILDTMAKTLQPPSSDTARAEGFERLYVVQNAEEVSALLRSWKIPESARQDVAHLEDVDHRIIVKQDSSVADEIPEVSGESDALLKFPRTSHIMNLGAATRDDKVLGPTDIAALVGPRHRIVVEEKLDGANMGISISKTENKIVVQNRSHFISSKYHAQFAPLDHWLNQHSAELWTMLTPGRHILYGEWLYATHSVKYTHLPGWFVAYDLYDRVTQSFISREALAELLAATTIPHVPLVYAGSVEGVEQLKALVDGPSAFNHARREGVVVRVCVGDRLVSRAKLVRPDFIAGNERWNKSSKLETNSLAPEAS